jgi:hypothetical protein
VEEDTVQYINILCQDKVGGYALMPSREDFHPVCVIMLMMIVYVIPGDTRDRDHERVLIQLLDQLVNFFVGFFSIVHTIILSECLSFSHHKKITSYSNELA